MGKWTRRWTRSIEKLLYRQRRIGDSLVPAKPVVVKMDERSQQDLLDSKSCSRSIDIPCMPRPGIYVLPSKPDAWNQSMNGQFLSVALRLLDTLNWTRREYKGKKGLIASVDLVSWLFGGLLFLKWMSARSQWDSMRSWIFDCVFGFRIIYC